MLWFRTRNQPDCDPAEAGVGAHSRADHLLQHELHSDEHCCTIGQLCLVDVLGEQQVVDAGWEFGLASAIYHSD